MVNTSEPPPYTPAAHLTSNSLLTAPQPVAQFEDSHKNLRYASTAAELVANLTETSNSTLESEQQKHEKELGELKCANKKYSYSTSGPKTATPSPAVAAIKRLNPRIGSFHTKEVRYWFKWCAQTSKVISYGRPYTAQPGLPIGITNIDIGERANARIKAYASNIHNDVFEIHIDSWGDTKLFGAACSWLEIEADDPDFQFGTYNTLDDHPADKCPTENSRKITFPRAYDATPKVVVWLAGFDINKDKNRRIKTFATDVTATGFTIHIDTWGGSILYSGISTWVAYPAGKPGVYSGRFSTSQGNVPCPAGIPGLYSGRLISTSPEAGSCGYEKFGDNFFRTPPRTMLAIDSLDVEYESVLRLYVKSSSVSAEGMNWELGTWLRTVLKSAGASYIALI